MVVVPAPLTDGFAPSDDGSGDDAEKSRASPGKLASSSSPSANSLSPDAELGVPACRLPSANCSRYQTLPIVIKFLPVPSISFDELAFMEHEEV